MSVPLYSRWEQGLFDKNFWAQIKDLWVEASKFREDFCTPGEHYNREEKCVILQIGVAQRIIVAVNLSPLTRF
ncbi:MAG: hypothetical protein DRR08_05035 [Candidatus Parabeggiatoa sp. nov. 2]|nr:MAG: hypothetical protein B6247_03780 [Beggiatoa sp. 4572_84]RKZ62824.1 MAG: hypothetical protein DRR08_05035 [Gammaproteobacteria bacterium]